MGRKLNALEAALTSFSDADAGTGQGRIILGHHQALQQIAQLLGISVDEFRKLPAQSNVVQSQGTSGAAFDPAVSHECMDLLDAYTRIMDPVQRLRCLQTVREAAYGSADADLDTEA